MEEKKKPAGLLEKEFFGAAVSVSCSSDGAY